MPTLSGRPKSALFGLVRTSSRGFPAFHEGIDLAPTSRDRQGRPNDPVFAVADGSVGYINAIAGNSNYGIYIVLLHREPVGEFYTLYAHLASIAPGILPGAKVSAGHVIGKMGHTPFHILPPARGHLHFEIGLIQNSRFDAWFRAKKQTPDHGIFNGQNLLGFDPLALFKGWDRERRFMILDHLRNEPRAFTLLISTTQPIDYFVRYPAFWQGAPMSPGRVVLEIAGSGLPVNGRMATTEERSDGNRNPLPLRVSQDATLAARRLVILGAGGHWRLSTAGKRWLEILLY